MWLIPGKTKVKIELIKGIGIVDMIVAGVCFVIILLTILSTLPFRWIIAGVLLFISILLLIRIDAEPNYMFLIHILLHATGSRAYRNQKYAHSSVVQNTNGLQTQAAAEVQETSEPKQKNEGEEAVAPTEGKNKKKSKTERKKGSAQAAKQSGREDPSGKNQPGIERIMAFTGISDGFIQFGGQYYGAVIEIPPVEFRFFSEYRRNNSIINGVGKSLRSANPDYASNIIKIERPVVYRDFIRRGYDMVDQLRRSFEQGAMNEEEFKIRIEILQDRIKDLESLETTDKVIAPFYYMVFFDKNVSHLRNQMSDCIRNMEQTDMQPKLLNDKELALFLRYNYDIDFDENEIESIDPADYAQWAMPRSLKLKSRTIEINDIITHNMRIVKFPGMVDDAWLASVMSFPATRVMIKCKPMDKAKSIRKIDWALQELRVQHENTSTDSKMLELQTQIESLSQLLVTLQGDNEALFNCNVYITTFDIETTNLWRGEKNPLPSERYHISGIKKQVRRMYQEHEFRVNDMDFRQMDAFIGAQVSAYDPLWKDAYGLPSNSVAASYPWVFANLADEGGMKLGASGHVPVFINFFRRDRERINSNMVIIGKSGSGKSYATKSLLTNLATEDAKIFILDPENEYTELASNLHGKFINVGNAQFGRLNPFHIITALDDDEAGATVSGSYATHLQFLEEFFRQILPECEKDALEYLNSLVDRMYFNFGITAETDLALLSPEDYPIFDDLYDIILEEFQKTDNAFIRTMLRTLMNYIAKFSTGGRNANIWNGPSTITTEENFTVFNFQSLLANRNQTIANAQMLLVLKYVDNEIIKNRDYNTKYNANRKIVVVIDEAHVFIDDKFPIALDFMYQLAKRIRKYNGMQIVITQNIKDFVGSEELVKKSTAIINACQYSLIFSLAPNDMDDLCKLYEKAGGINQTEQEEIVSAPRGQAFAVMSPTSRSTFQVEVPQSVEELFQQKEYQTHYFAGAEGAQVWEDFLGDSREKYDESTKWKQSTREKRDEASRTSFRFSTLGDHEEPFPVKPETPKPIPVLEEEAKEAEDLDDLIDQIQTENAPVLPRRFVAPETVSPIEPAPVMQPPQVQVDLSTTNSLLRSVLEQFTSDSIQMQVERIVKQQLEQSVQPILERMQQEPVAPHAPAQPQPAAEEEPQTSFPVETEEEEPLFDFSNIFEEESDDSDMEEPADPVGFDLRAMLCQEAEKLEGMGAIELMFYYEEDTAQIKLEDLAQYTRSLRRKR